LLYFLASILAVLKVHLRQAIWSLNGKILISYHFL
jgi:hypothetical protein